ncbi:MAG: hypothetical protein ACI8YQ_000107 [Polaribacter sp.]|jgi:hypothetical protein
MKNNFIEHLFLATFFLLYSASSISAQEFEEPSREDLNPQVIAQITTMTERYSKHRKKTTDIYKAHGYDSKQMLDNETLIYEDDLKNRAIAKKVFKKHGYPGISMVGKEKSHEFWVIVQNCNMDVDFQLAVLKVTDKLIYRGEADAHDYAYLSDRVRINLGQKQIYGTQVEFNKAKNSYEPFELNKPEEVDARRQELNLESMAKYIDKMNKKYEGTLKRKPRTRRYIKKP